MKRFSGIECVDMVSDNHLDLPGQYINEFFAFMLVSDAFMLLQGIDGDPKINI